LRKVSYVLDKSVGSEILAALVGQICTIEIRDRRVGNLVAGLTALAEIPQ